MRRRARVDAMATMATMTEPLRVSGLRRLGDEIAHNPPQQCRSADNCADCVSPSWRAAGGGGDLSDLRFRSHASPFPVRTIDAIASTVLGLLEFLRSIVTKSPVQLFSVMPLRRGLRRRFCLTRYCAKNRSSTSKKAIAAKS